MPIINGSAIRQTEGLETYYGTDKNGVHSSKNKIQHMTY